MTNLHHITQLPWFTALSSLQQKMVKQSLELLQREKRLKSHFSDYSFILFPLSKAYEGFLKDFLVKQQLISEHEVKSRRFRIGRSLNPDIRQHHRDEQWLYDDLARNCGQDLARAVWEAWVECRNQVFHYFPDRNNEFDLGQIEKKVQLLLQVMERASYCTSYQ